MYCIAQKTVLPSLTQEQREHLLAEAGLHSLSELLEAVPDPRRKQGLRSDLPFLLSCLIAALLCKSDGTEAVAQWCRDHVTLLQDVFGPACFSPPLARCIVGFYLNSMLRLWNRCWAAGFKQRQRQVATKLWRWMAKPCRASRDA